MRFTDTAELVGARIGVCDSDTDKSLTANKVVDITGDCPQAKQFLLKYAPTKRGPIVQLCELYEPGDDTGVLVHYHYAEMGKERLTLDPVFARFAEGVGISPVRMAEVILTNAPSR